MSFLRVRVCGGYGGPPGVWWATRVCRVVAVLGRPLVAVFFGVRLGGRGIPGNVLLSEIYILALSKPPKAPQNRPPQIDYFPPKNSYVKVYCLGGEGGGPPQKLTSVMQNEGGGPQKLTSVSQNGGGGLKN